LCRTAAYSAGRAYRQKDEEKRFKNLLNQGRPCLTNRQKENCEENQNRNPLAESYKRASYNSFLSASSKCACVYIKVFLCNRRPQYYGLLILALVPVGRLCPGAGRPLMVCIARGCPQDAPAIPADALGYPTGDICTHINACFAARRNGASRAWWLPGLLQTLG
jgi:hypothetical protein